MTFTTTLRLEGKTATGLEVPATYVEALGGGKRPPVVVTLNGGYSYRSTVMPYDGMPMLPLAAEHRNAAGLKAGDSVEVTLTLDTAPRTVEIPADVASALEGAPGAAQAFDRLSPSQRKAHVVSVESAKTPETRTKRIAKILDALPPPHS